MPSVFWPADSSNETSTWTVVSACAAPAVIARTSSEPATNEAKPRTLRARIIDMAFPPSGVMESSRPYEGSRVRTRGEVRALRRTVRTGLVPCEGFVTRRRLSVPSGRDHYHPRHRSRRFLTVALSSVSSVAHRGDDRVRGRVYGRRLSDIAPPDHSPLHGAWSRRSDHGAGGCRVDGQVGRLSARRAHPTERRGLGRRRHLHRGRTRRRGYHRRRRLLDEPDLGTADSAGFPRATG